MDWCGEVQQGFGKGLFPYVEDKLFYGLCWLTGLMPAPVPGLLPTDSVPELGLSAETHSLPTGLHPSALGQPYSWAW